MVTDRPNEAIGVILTYHGETHSGVTEDSLLKYHDDVVAAMYCNQIPASDNGPPLVVKLNGRMKQRKRTAKNLPSAQQQSNLRSVVWRVLLVGLVFCLVVAAYILGKIEGHHAVTTQQHEAHLVPA